MARKKQLLHSLTHLLIGIALTLKGADKLSHHPVIGTIILAFGIIILLYFIYINANKHHSDKLDLIVHCFEGTAALFTAYIFYEEGAKYLQYVFLLAAIGFFLSIYLHNKKKHHGIIEQ
jgi:uncharacterized membrane protein